MMHRGSINPEEAVMAPVSRRWWLGPVLALATVASLSACAAPPTPSRATSTSPTPSPTITSTTVVTPPPTQAARTKNWFDLDAGDCLADPPPDDPNVIAVTLVDCATAHRAEVYLRQPMAVNTALTDVADRDCDEGFVDYTGRQVGSGPLSITYLIDSDQNRTSSNPNPSAVICLLVDADGQALTGSAHRELSRSRTRAGGPGTARLLRA